MSHMPRDVIATNLYLFNIEEGINHGVNHRNQNRYNLVPVFIDFGQIGVLVLNNKRTKSKIHYDFTYKL